MKTLKNTLTAIIILLFTISCSKSDDSTPTPTPTNNDYFFNATVDGSASYAATEFQVGAASTTSSGGTPRITVTTSIASVGNFQITLDNHVGASTYSIGTPGYTLRFQHGVSGESTAYAANTCPGLTGTLTITAISATEISGTFSFTAKKAGACGVDAKVITNGSFKSKLFP